jgi:hypothetical protein
MMVSDSFECADMNFSSLFEPRFDRSWSNPSWWNLLVALPWVVLVLFDLYGFRTDQITAAREQTTSGQIISHDAPNHNRFGYQFGVNGKVYTGWASPSADEYQIGQKVLVYYDSLDPHKSALDDFAETGDRIVGPVSFCLFGISGVSLYIFLRRRAIHSKIY